ncbi:47_t:CDS:2 [Diversispora eburnea]|uniref:47_t:CDS:1 n=1 Tax=Diversispora eburnea TaxID=1213867 RepID=A0A9N9GJ52_9GLOM|nr:47_t:CDS:2 [Diversispora eburnea]
MTQEPSQNNIYQRHVFYPKESGEKFYDIPYPSFHRRSQYSDISDPSSSSSSHLSSQIGLLSMSSASSSSLPGSPLSFPPINNSDGSNNSRRLSKISDVHPINSNTARSYDYRFRSKSEVISSSPTSSFNFRNRRHENFSSPDLKFKYFFKKSKKNNQDYIKAKESLFSQQYSESISFFTKVLAKYPYSYSVRCDRAYAYYQTEKWNLALQDLKVAITRRPSKPVAYALRGEICRLIKMYDSSMSDLSKSIKLQPSAFALRARAEVHCTLSRYSDAINDLNFALKIEPKNSFTLIRRAKVYVNLHSALVDLNRVLTVQPNWCYPLSLRGSVYRTMGCWSDALTDLDLALENVRDKAYYIGYETQALINRGSVYRVMNRHEDALTDLNKGLLREPDNLLALCERSAVYFAMKNYEAAIRDLDKVLKIQPKYATAIKQKENYITAMQESGQLTGVLKRQSIARITRKVLENPEE